MKKELLCCFVFLCCLSTILAQDKWVISQKGEKFGYIDSRGEVKIPYQYPFVYTDTLSTIALVSINNKIKAIDRNNNPLFTVFTYDGGPDYPEEDVFRIVNDSTGKMGFADEMGEIVIAPTFDFVLPFSSGLAAFNIGGHQERLEDGHSVIEDGKWGFIDHDGATVFPAIFDNAWSFNSDGEIDVSIGDRSFKILAR